MDSVIFSFFLIFIKVTHSLRYGIADNLQPYMWVNLFRSSVLLLGFCYFYFFFFFFTKQILKGWFASSHQRCFSCMHFLWSLGKLLVHLHIHNFVKEPEGENHSYSCFRAIKGKLGDRSVLQMLAYSMCCCVLLSAFFNITVIYMIIYQLHVDGLHCIPKSARGVFFKLSEMKRQIIITGILNPQMVNKELDFGVRRFSGYDQYVFSHATMCTAGCDSNYYCLWNEQLDAVLRFLLSCPVCSQGVTEGEIVSKIM